MKKGDKVRISENWIVKDENAKSNKGIIVFDVDKQKVQGYAHEWNYYYRIKLDDGDVKTFNEYELIKTK